MALTDITCRSAKPGNKPYKLTDSQGPYLLWSHPLANAAQWHWASIPALG